MAINVFEGARRIAKLLAALWVGGWVVAAFYVSPSVNVTYKIANPGAASIRITEECPADSATEHVYDKVTQSGTKTAVTLCLHLPKKPKFSVDDVFSSRVGTETENPFDKFDTASQPPKKQKFDIDLALDESAPAPEPDPELPEAPGPPEPEVQAAETNQVQPLPQPKIDKSKIEWDSPQAVPLREVDFDPFAEMETFVLPQSDEEWIDGQWWPLFMKEIGWGALGAVSGLLFLLAFTWTTGWIVRGFMGIPKGQDHKE